MATAPRVAAPPENGGLTDPLDDDLSAANSFRREHYDLGHNLVTLDGEHAVFGDGRITCIPAPGHTSGHRPLRIRLGSGEVVSCADCAHFEATLDGAPLPRSGTMPSNTPRAS